MSRCQHCKKLTHSEHVNVYYDSIDSDKIFELQELENWTCKWQYNNLEGLNPLEFGKLKCGDIVLHFIMKKMDINLDG